MQPFHPSNPSDSSLGCVICNQGGWDDGFLSPRTPEQRNVWLCPVLATRCAPPAVATCNAKSRPPSLLPPAPWNPASAASLSVSTVIYYTSIVMITCLIHNVYCGRKKWLVNLKNRALLQRWQEKKKQKKTSQWEKAHLTIYYCLRLLEGWHVQLTLHETAAAFYSQKTYLSHHTDWGGNKGCPLHRAPGKVIKPQLYFRQLADAHVPGDLQRVRK